VTRSAPRSSFRTASISEAQIREFGRHRWRLAFFVLPFYSRGPVGGLMSRPDEKTCKASTRSGLPQFSALIGHNHDRGRSPCMAIIQDPSCEEE
jgi:hypothetical protein